MNWYQFRRVYVVVALLALTMTIVVRNAGVQEIRRTGESINFAMIDARPSTGDWPWWGGSTQSNTAPFEHPPIQWSSGSDQWSASIPGRGRAGMCIWGNQLFLPTLDAASQTVSVACLDPTTGRMQWQTELHRGLSSHPPRFSQFSPTPACDGQHVYMACPDNGSLWISAIDMQGRIAWQREAGPYFSKWGYGSSPTIYKSLVIVAADNKGARINRLVGSSYLTAVHRQTGEIVWRIHRPEGDSLGTPVVARIAGRDQLLLAGRKCVCSYDPLTGDKLWTCSWSSERVANSVAFDDQHVYASSRQPQQELICIRADGEGDVTTTHVVWRSNKGASDLPSPIAHDGRLYTVTDDSVLSCLDTATGQPVWKRRLGGIVSASPAIAGQHLYCCNEEGTMFVIRLGGRGDLVAEIPVGESIYTSPIFSGNRLYLRTISSLHCISSHEERPFASQPESARRRM